MYVMDNKFCDYVIKNCDCLHFSSLTINRRRNFKMRKILTGKMFFVLQQQMTGIRFVCFNAHEQNLANSETTLCQERC